MSTINVYLVNESVQSSFLRSTYLVGLVMVITIMFKGYKRFSRCLILFNLRYKQTVLKVKEVFEFKMHRSLYKGL